MVGEKELYRMSLEDVELEGVGLYDLRHCSVSGTGSGVNAACRVHTCATGQCTP